MVTLALAILLGLSAQAWGLPLAHHLIRGHDERTRRWQLITAGVGVALLLQALLWIWLWTGLLRDLLRA